MSVSGFYFDKRQRNEKQNEAGTVKPIEPFVACANVAAIKFNNGIIIGVDTRGTRNELIHYSDINKVFKLHDNVFCGGVGVMSDLENTTRFVNGQLTMLNRRTNRRVLTCSAKHLLTMTKLRLPGVLIASYIVAGVDKTGAQLFTVHFDGTSENLLYNSVGMDAYGTTTVLEDRWTKDMTEQQANDAILDAISSGNQYPPFTFTVDICVVRNDFTTERRLEIVNSLREHEMELEVDDMEIEPNWKNAVIIGLPKVYNLDPPSDSESQLPDTYDQLKIAPACTNLGKRNAKPKKKKSKISNTKIGDDRYI